MDTNQSLAEPYKTLHTSLKHAFSLPQFKSGTPRQSVLRLLSDVALCLGGDAFEMYDVLHCHSGVDAFEEVDIGFIAQWKEETENGGHRYPTLFESLRSSLGETLSSTAANGIVLSYLDDISHGLTDFLQSPEPVPLWAPNETLPHAQFLKNLTIPASSKDGPDMLLHDLGNFRENQVFQRLTTQLFPPGPGAGPHLANTLLLNTSGSGKTRTMLECLCQRWGLYFTCCVDDERHGSTDLHAAIHERIGADASFRAELSSVDLNADNRRNCDIAGARFAEVLLARLCIMEFFCDTAQKISNGHLTNDHRKRWVLLQVKPSCIGHGDIFEKLARKLTGIGNTHRRFLIQSKTKKLAQLNGSYPLFCVVDEAQIAATAFPHAFLPSSNDEDLGQPDRRPILRELAKAFKQHPYDPISLNLTGTAIDKLLIMQVMSSRTFKAVGIKTVTHIGDFDDAEEQMAYMNQFLPTELASSEPYRKLYKRVSYWLRGRYRFTAAYMKDLLITGFQKPHLMLNEFVRSSTVFRTSGHGQSPGFKLTDSREYWEDGEVVAPAELIHFSFHKLKKDATLESLIRTHTAIFWMRSEISPLLVDQETLRLVQHGFARYSKYDTGNSKDPRIALNEPLALLALGEWLQSCDLPLAETLRQNAGRGGSEARGANGLEEYIALYLSGAFEGNKPLKDIFLFNELLDLPEWAKRPAKLVSLWRENVNEEPEEGVVEFHKRPSVTIGKAISRVEDTMAWLRHTDRAPICFPDKFIGPDLLFVLQLQDEAKSLIWVAVQCKFHDGDTLPFDTLAKALSTVTPNEFYALRKETAADEGRKAEDRKTWRKSVLELLDSLPRRLRTPALELESVGTEGKGKEQALKDNLIAHLNECARKKGIAKHWDKVKKARGKDVGTGQPRRTSARNQGVKDPEPLAGFTDKHREILQGAGKHSLLRVVVAWPANADMHKRAVKYLSETNYFDSDGHPIVELNVPVWGDTMKNLHETVGSYVDAVGPGGKRKALMEAEGAPPDKRAKMIGSSTPSFHVSHSLWPTRTGADAGDDASIATPPPSSHMNEEEEDMEHQAFGETDSELDRLLTVETEFKEPKNEY